MTCLQANITGNINIFKQVLCVLPVCISKNIKYIALHCNILKHIWETREELPHSGLLLNFWEKGQYFDHFLKHSLLILGITWYLKKIRVGENVTLILQLYY